MKMVKEKMYEVDTINWEVPGVLVRDKETRRFPDEELAQVIKDAVDELRPNSASLF